MDHNINYYVLALCQVLYKHLFAHLVVLTTLVLLSLIDQQVSSTRRYRDNHSFSLCSFVLELRLLAGTLYCLKTLVFCSFIHSKQ